MQVDVIGVYPVAAPEPCHLVEVRVTGAAPEDIVSSITQEAPGQPRENWQVPYDEHYLTADGVESESASLPNARVAFFFHYLDLRRPLLTAAGSLQLPAPSSRPARLEFIRYDPPC